MRPLNFFIILLVSGFINILSSQENQTPPVLPTSAEERMQSFKVRQKLKETSLIKNIPFRSAGPSVMSGRVVDIDADPADGTHFYAAYASGGLWYTDDNGTSFTSIFDNQPVMTIGDIAVDWKNGQTIWLGSGENNSSRSSYSGNGVYKSSDQGKTWQHLGLGESHHIGRIVIHPENPDMVWAASMGHLYSSNPERGVFKTADGGKTWRKTLYVNDNTGVIDLVINPKNPMVLYASSWERTRRAWDFTESGEGSAIYKSTDGGETWKLLTAKESGFPAGKGAGRIGLDIFPGNPDILYASLDNQFFREEEKEKHAVTKDMLRSISVKKFLSLNEDELNDFLDRCNFPMEFDADTLFQLVKEEKIKPQTLVEYLEDANAQLFDTPVIGAEVYRSDNAGKSWYKTHESYLDNVVYTFGYYFGEIRVSPFNADQIYLLGVPVLESADGGKNFSTIGSDNVHADHHAMWLNPKRDGHIILGNDGGLNISYDYGKHWLKANSLPVSQFYTVAVDMDEPYNIYGGMQDNGVWSGPSNYKAGSGWTASGHYPYKGLMGGDGMQIAVDTRDNNTVYTGYQFGNYFRIDKAAGKTKYIKPKHSLGERPLRFNWQTPIWLSSHNQDILYLGSNKLHRSMDKGETWQSISSDLTSGGKKGDVPYGTLTSIHESPLQFGLIYAGSDDGLVHITKDGGHTWKNISGTLPKNFWISRVTASAHDTGTVYISLNGYRWDNFEALIYKSTDYGQNWEQIGLDLPAEPVNVIKEDPKNKNILYTGTDHGLYASINSGKSFMAFSNGLPDAPLHDLVIHSRENEIIAGTHGRSIYIASVKHLQELNDEMLQKALHIFPMQDINYNKNWGSFRYDWRYVESSKLTIPYYCKTADDSRIRIFGTDKFVLAELKQKGEAGLNYVEFDLAIGENQYKKYFKDEKETKAADNGKYYLKPGEYTVEILHAGNQKSIPFDIKEQKKKSRKKKKKTP